jgi:hypothetical protein
MQIFPWKKDAQQFGLILYFSKTAQRKQWPKTRNFAQFGHPVIIIESRYEQNNTSALLNLFTHN